MEIDIKKELDILRDKLYKETRAEAEELGLQLYLDAEYNENKASWEKVKDKIEDDILDSIGS